MPKTTNAEVRRKIKQIASMAGINTPVMENGVAALRWTFVWTYTARRSAATNLAMQGGRWILLRSWRCWKKLEVLKKNLLASGLDVAKVVAEYDFFRSC
jgi:hypothetical protein